MSPAALTSSGTPAHPVQHQAPSPHICNWSRGLLAAERTKLRSARPAGWLLLCAATITIASGMLGCRWVAIHWESSSHDVTAAPFGGLPVAALLTGLLGALAITIEYSSGLIRTTFTAVPQRLSVLAAKAVAVGVLTLAAGEAVSFTVFLAGQSILSSRYVGVSLASPGALRTVLAAGLYPSLTALLGLGLGAVFRGITWAVVTLFLIASPLADLVLPAIATPRWRSDVFQYLLTDNGRWLMFAAPDKLGAEVSTVHAIVVCAAYPLLALLAGAVMIARRDA